MKAKTVSLRRRHLMIAGIAGSTVPATGLAALCPRGEGVDSGILGVTIRRGDSLLVSGRVVDAACAPVAGARVEVLRDGAHAASATFTDGDGRFMVTATAARATAILEYRVSHDEHGERVNRLRFARSARRGREAVAALQRDEAGVWRTTCALTLA